VRKWWTPLILFSVGAYAISWLIWFPQVAEAKGWIEAVGS